MGAIGGSGAKDLLSSFGGGDITDILQGMGCHLFIMGVLPKFCPSTVKPKKDDRQLIKPKVEDVVSKGYIQGPD